MVYLDYNATAPLDPLVLEAMLPYLRSFYGNPSGLYRLGRLSRGAIDRAREQVAALVGAEPSQVLFTSGGTEGNNLALKGVALSQSPGLIISGSTEHPSVNEPLEYLESQGWQLGKFPTDRTGCPDLSMLEAVQGGGIRMATLMWANNETGVIHDLPSIAHRVRSVGGYFHVDAVQAVGKIPVSFAASGAHTLSLSAHKIRGPKGVGALIVHRDTPLKPLMQGGGQEAGRRAGTENVAGIVGFGQAAELALAGLETWQSRVKPLRLKLENGLKALSGVTIFAEQSERLANTVQFAISAFEGETLVMALDRLGFALSSGSACSSGGNEPSPVLLAMGVEPGLARGAVRVSLGQETTEADIEHLLSALTSLVQKAG